MKVTKAKIAKDYPGIELVGAEDGYFKDDLKPLLKELKILSLIWFLQQLVFLDKRS
jgi:UDP-N-acetyl-D-mannosaminuronic acid transferase (WecB/TagA/CpsF family)